MRLAALALLAAAGLGCEYTAPHRTLPERIQTIYIPMPENDSFMYGMQEELARHLHEQFLADGRLRPVRRELADGILQTRIRDFSRQPTGFNSDDYPISDRSEVEAVVTLWEPNREDPTVRTRTQASVGYLSDPRRSQFITDPEWQNQMLENLAVNIVQAVLTYYPDSASGQADFFGEGVVDEEAEQRPDPDLDLDRDFIRGVPSIGNQSYF